jgi:acyl dehydratase
VDVAPGTEVPPLTIDEIPTEPMKTVAALLEDSNPIHWDADAVRGLGMGEKVVNQGPNNMAYVVNMLVAWAGSPEAVRNLRVRFLGNVLGGDAVTARGVVKAVREENGERLADVDVWLERSAEDRVLDGTAIVAVG